MQTDSTSWCGGQGGHAERRDIAGLPGVAALKFLITFCAAFSPALQRCANNMEQCATRVLGVPAKSIPPPCSTGRLHSRSATSSCPESRVIGVDDKFQRTVGCCSTKLENIAVCVPISYRIIAIALRSQRQRRVNMTQRVPSTGSSGFFCDSHAQVARVTTVHICKVLAKRCRSGSMRQGFSTVNSFLRVKRGTGPRVRCSRRYPLWVGRVPMNIIQETAFFFD